MVRRLTACLVLLASTAVFADAWRSVNGESVLEFVPSYEDTLLPSRFERFDVLFEFDPTRPGAGRLVVTVDVTSADMQDAELNDEIGTQGWFATATHPRARFVSSDLRRTDAGYSAHGTLVLKGVERPVRVPFRFESDGTRARLHGELQLDRSEFGIGTGEWADDGPIAHAVGVRFDVLLEPAE